jgi:hypothetical protein
MHHPTIRQLAKSFTIKTFLSDYNVLKTKNIFSFFIL